jgi:hypothetical protein
MITKDDTVDLSEFGFTESCGRVYVKFLHNSNYVFVPGSYLYDVLNSVYYRCLELHSAMTEAEFGFNIPAFATILICRVLGDFEVPEGIVIAATCDSVEAKHVFGSDLSGVSLDNNSPVVLM